MRTISKLWKTGGSVVITVPISWLEYYNLKEGDSIDWGINNTKKKAVKHDD